MSTEEQEAKALAVRPDTGEVVDLASATTTELADIVREASAHMDKVADFRREVIAEATARMDLENSRTVHLDAGDRIYTLVTNAPEEESYPLPKLRAALAEAVEKGLISQAAMDKVIFTPDPKPPEPKVAKAELNKLLRRGDVARIIAPVRVRNPQNRTLKVDVESKR